MPIPVRRDKIKRINAYFEQLEADREKKQGVLSSDKNTDSLIETLKQKYQENSGKSSPDLHVHTQPKPKKPGL